MLNMGADALVDYGSEEVGEDEQDLAAENLRLKQELQKYRSRARSSSLETLEQRNHQRRSTLALHGKAQEQLREVLEENELLVERLKAKENEVEDWRYQCAKLHQRLEQEQQGKLDASEHEQPKDLRLWKKKAHEVMRKVQEEKEKAAEAGDAKRVLKHQLEDSRAQVAKAKAEIVRLERELSRSQASNNKKQAAMNDLQQQYEELRTMLDGGRTSVEQLTARVQQLEEELEAERMRQSNPVESLDGLGNFLQSSEADSNPGELAAIFEDEELGSMEMSPQVMQHCARLQRQCDELQAELSMAERTLALERKRKAEGTKAAGHDVDLEALKQQDAHIEALQRQNDDLSQKLQASAGLPAENEVLRREAEDLRARLHGLEDLPRQNEELKKLHEGQRNEVEDLRQKLQGLEDLPRQNEELKQALRSNGDVDELRQQILGLQDLPRENAELKQQQETLRGENEQLKLSLSSVVGLQTENDELKRKLSQAQDSDDALARQTEQDCGRECEDLRAKLASAQSGLAASEAEQRELLGRCETSARREEELSEECSALQKKLDAQEEVLEREEGLKKQELVGEELRELRRKLADSSQLEQELAVARGAAAEEERELRREHAEARCELADSARLEQELRQERELIRKKLADASQGQERAVAEGLREEVEELRRELAGCAAQEGELQRLRQEASEAREELAASSDGCSWLRRQLDGAQELQQALRGEHEQFRRRLADAAEVEVEQRREVDRLRRELATKSGAAEAEEALHAASEQLEALRRRDQELLEEQARAVDSETQPEEPQALRRECDDLRQRLQAAKVAELEAERRAAVVPELMNTIVALQGQVTATERLAAEWREAATSSTWPGVLSSFVCAAPERRRASRLTPAEAGFSRGRQ